MLFFKFIFCWPRSDICGFKDTKHGKDVLCDSSTLIEKSCVGRIVWGVTVHVATTAKGPVTFLSRQKLRLPRNYCYLFKSTSHDFHLSTLKTIAHFRQENMHIQQATVRWRTCVGLENRTDVLCNLLNSTYKIINYKIKDCVCFFTSY